MSSFCACVQVYMLCMHFSWVHNMLQAIQVSLVFGIWIVYPDPLNLHSPACLILLSPGSSSLSHTVTLLPPLPPQFPQHLTGQGITAHLTQGGLAQVFFAPQQLKSTRSSCCWHRHPSHASSEWQEKGTVSCFHIWSGLCFYMNGNCFDWSGWKMWAACCLLWDCQY